MFRILIRCNACLSQNCLLRRNFFPTKKQFKANPSSQLLRYSREQTSLVLLSQFSFQHRNYVVHWEKEELPGTSKDPVVVSYNERIRDCLDCGDLETAEGIFSLSILFMYSVKVGN
jgi:hypothetical protein